MTKAVENAATSGYRIVGISLVDVSINQRGYDAELEETATFEYSVRYEKPQATEENVAPFRAKLEVMKLYGENEEPVTKIACDYFCVLRWKPEEPHGDLGDAAQMITGSTIWGQFCTLSAVLSQQLGVPFPLLPVMPAHIETLEEDDE